MATVSARKLVVYSTNDGSVVQDIPPGQMNGTVPCEYRNCRYVSERAFFSFNKLNLNLSLHRVSFPRYGSHASAGYLFLFLNTAGASKQHTRAFIAKFKTADYTQIKNRAVSRSSITAAAVSQGGNVLGVAFADLSVGVFGAEKLDVGFPSEVFGSESLCFDTPLTNPTDSLHVKQRARVCYNQHHLHARNGPEQETHPVFFVGGRDGRLFGGTGQGFW